MEKCMLEVIIESFEERVQRCRACSKLLECADWFQVLARHLEDQWIIKKNKGGEKR